MEVPRCLSECWWSVVVDSIGAVGEGLSYGEMGTGLTVGYDTCWRISGMVTALPLPRVTGERSLLAWVSKLSLCSELSDCVCHLGVFSNKDECFLFSRGM